MAAASLVIGIIVVLFVATVVFKSVKIVPQARAGIVERLGRYMRTLEPGLNFLIPFVDRVKPLIDLREQVVSFEPRSVITADNLVVDIDTVLYFQVTNPRDATYEIANYIQAVEQLTVTTLRNVVGGMDLESVLTSREAINSELRGVLDEATGKWGIRVNRVEIKAIDPPKTIKEAMEKQMRAERDKRAAILNAEGFRQSQILSAEGEKQSAILKAEGGKQAAILTAEGEARAIDTVFTAIHDGNPDPKLLAYQYLRTLPKMAEGGNATWVIPGELTSALRGVSEAFARDTGEAHGTAPRAPQDSAQGDAAEAARQAAAEAARLSAAVPEAAALNGADTPAELPESDHPELPPVPDLPPARRSAEPMT
ncbi:MAG TPA: SPFH domain-containing protein [Streptosporangiaceae bacterium]|jgi:regulator of protease activity HflC (stomatin/prohibitin superfamily)